MRAAAATCSARRRTWLFRADGTLQTIKSAGFVEGFELTVKNWLWYTYYGDIYIDKAQLVDANGKSLIGYGYTGSPNSQNRNIAEFSLGFNETLWKNPRYGALNFMGQYEYLFRDPWYVALNAPKGAHDNTLYFNFRYSLPGSMPSSKKRGSDVSCSQTGNNSNRFVTLG